MLKPLKFPTCEAHFAQVEPVSWALALWPKLTNAFREKAATEGQSTFIQSLSGILTPVIPSDVFLQMTSLKKSGFLLSVGALVHRKLEASLCEKVIGT